MEAIAAQARREQELLEASKRDYVEQTMNRLNDMSFGQFTFAW